MQVQQVDVHLRKEHSPCCNLYNAFFYISGIGGSVAQWIIYLLSDGWIPCLNLFTTQPKYF